MGYLFDNYCYETQAEALASFYGNSGPISSGSYIYFPSFQSGNWSLKSAGTQSTSIALPSISFPICDPVGPAHIGEEITLASDFWIPLFWAIGISAAFMLFKKA